MTGRIAYGAPLSSAPLSVAQGESDLGEIYSAAVEQMRLVDNTNGAYAALEDAYAKRTREIRQATGIDLGNPLLGSEADLDPARILETGGGALLEQVDASVDRARKRYDDRLQQLAAQYPQHSAIIKATTPIERDAEEIARGADADLARLMEASPGWGKFAASVAGGAVGSFRDPLTIGSMFAGGGPGGARTIAGRILQVAAREAAINGGTEAAAQPFVQAWRERAGLPNGFDQATLNVLFAAGLGGALGGAAGGGHELVTVLKQVRGALPPAQRGAIEAAEQLEALDQLRPETIPPARFEARAAAADAIVQRVDPGPLELDELTVRKLVDSLAPSRDSVSGQPALRTDAEIDRLALPQPKAPEGSGRVSKPISDYVRSLGGIDPSAPIAAELRAAGVTAPSLFRRGGLKSIDNLPHDELAPAVRHEIEADGNGYASQQGLIDALAREAAAEADVADIRGPRDFYEERGVDFTRPIEEVRAAVRAVDELEHRWTGQSDEAVSVPEGMSRREHTAELVRQVLRAQPGLSDDLVRQAVNLSLFERQPIDEALSDVMSDAAGVRRTAPPAGTGLARTIDELGSEPPELPAEPIVREEGEDVLDLAAERAALEELGFTGGALPIGDELLGFDEIEARISEAEWLERVVEACKL